MADPYLEGIETTTDPYLEGAEPATETKLNEMSEASANLQDPYFQGVESLSKPLNGTMQKKELPLRGWEKRLAEWNPTAYALGRVFVEDFAPFVGMPFTIPLVYAKYAFPSNRDDFMQLDQTDQTRALLYDSLFVSVLAREKELLTVAGMAWRGLVKKPVLATTRGIGKTIGIAAKAPKVVPYEDAVKSLEGMIPRERIKPFSYVEEVKKKLGNRGFGEDEAEAIASVLTGEGEGALLDLVVGRKYAGRETTKAFKEAIEWQSGRAYPMPKLGKKIAAEYAEGVVRQKFYAKQFEEALIKDVYKGTEVSGTVEGVFKAHAERLFPKAKGLGFGDVTPHQMTNIILDMMGNKIIARQAAHPTLMATLHPARIVFGFGERTLGTVENVYEAMKGYLGRMNRSYFNHSLLLTKMLEQRGAYTSVRIKATGEFVAKKAKWFTPKVQNEAHTALRLMDDLSMKAERAGKGEAAAIQEQIKRVGENMSMPAKLLVDTTRTFYDHLYSEHVKLQIPRLFGKVKLTRLGQNQLDKMMSGPSGLNYEVDRLFSTLSSKNSTEKITGMKDILGKVRARLESPGTKHPYFRAEGAELINQLKDLGKQLSWEKGGFMRYLDNYAARVADSETKLVGSWVAGIPKNQQAFYTKARTFEKMKGKPVNFGITLQARTLAHAKEHYLYDGIDEVMKFAAGLPPAWKSYVEDYVTGILGRAKPSDFKLAHFFTSTIGGMARLIGKEGLWDEQRVMRFAQTLNNLTYMGGLGLKPFSAIRNLFQPLVTVPADLGGLRDLGSLVSGYRRAMNPADRKYLQSIGIITDYVPEINLRPTMIKQGKVLFGMEMPTMEGTRDVMLWGFKASDRMNRYVAGGAALNKWEKQFRKFGEIKPKDVEAFSKKMSLSKRREWKKAEIEDLLWRGKTADAKAVYIRDVVADTQYLYGAADAPVILRKHGSLGKTGFIFQSWWMNYGSLIHKWVTVGESPGAKVERMITVMVSQGMAYTMMEAMWGSRSAAKATFLGPFPPGLSEFSLPPSWAPVYHLTRAVFELGNPDMSARHAKAVLDSAMILAPAGLQAKMFYRGAKDEGWEGFGKAFLRLK